MKALLRWLGLWAPDGSTTSLAGMFADLAERKQVEVIINKSPAVPDFLRGDPLRLGQVLVNLVNNAIKFTERGEVEVAITLVNQHPMRVRFSVRDTGIGIAEEKQAQCLSHERAGRAGGGIGAVEQQLQRHGEGGRPGASDAAPGPAVVGLLPPQASSCRRRINSPAGSRTSAGNAGGASGTGLPSAWSPASTLVSSSNLSVSVTRV